MFGPLKSSYDDENKWRKRIIQIQPKRLITSKKPIRIKKKSLSPNLKFLDRLYRPIAKAPRHRNNWPKRRKVIYRSLDVPKTD